MALSSTTPIIRVRPSVLFTILDSIERRGPDEVLRPAIGILLGSVDGNLVEINNAFRIRYITDASQEFKLDRHEVDEAVKTFHLASPGDDVLGWFSGAAEIPNFALFVQQHVRMYCPRGPLLLTLDTEAANGRINLEAYTGTLFGVPKKTNGWMFAHVPVEIALSDFDQIALAALKADRNDTLLMTDTEHLSQVLGDNQRKIEVLRTYVDKVLNRQAKSDSAVGRRLMELIDQVPNVSGEELEQMMNTSIKDLLMVVYLTTLTKAQMSLHEKLAVV